MAKLIYDHRVFLKDRRYTSDCITFTSDGYIITHGTVYNASGIIADSDVNKLFIKNNQEKYKLTINNSTKGDSNGTSLGTIFAPTNSGSNNQIILNISGIPTWVSLETDLGTGENTIPSSSAVSKAIASSVTSYFRWKGSIETVPTTGVVGDAYLITKAGSIPAANSASGKVETLEVGDIIILSEVTTSKVLKWAVAQSNWTATAGTSTLTWDKDATLATIGGIDIKAKLPTLPTISYTPLITDNTTNSYKIGDVTNTNGTSFSIYGTIGNFAVGSSKATSDSNVTSGPIYLTSVLNSTAKDILGLNAGSGISLSNNSKVITITNSGVRSISGSTSNGITTIKYNQNGTDDTISFSNTWRDIKASTNGTTTDSIGTNTLELGTSFKASIQNNVTTIDLCWAEIDEEGTITYV